MLFRKTRSNVSRVSDLSASELEAIEDIRLHWRCRANEAPSHHEVIELALRNIERDLDSQRRREVIGDLEREIAYRQWRATNLQKPGEGSFSG